MANIFKVGNRKLLTEAAERRQRLISAEEFMKHTQPTDLWTCINGQVVDVTKYQDKHPGSAQVLRLWGGVWVTDR